MGHVVLQKLNMFKYSPWCEYSYYVIFKLIKKDMTTVAVLLNVFSQVYDDYRTNSCRDVGSWLSLKSLQFSICIPIKFALFQLTGGTR